MTATVCADDFGAFHPEGIIFKSFDCAGKTLRKSGPSTAGIEFRCTLVQRSATRGAIICSFAFELFILSRSRPLGALLSNDTELYQQRTNGEYLFRGEDCSPFRFAFLDGVTLSG